MRKNNSMSNVSNDRRERMKQRQIKDAEKKKGNSFSVLDRSMYPELEDLKLSPNTEYVLDILPYEVTSKKHPEYAALKKDDFLEDYKLEVAVHRNIGPTKASIVCPKEYGKTCEICDEHDRLLAEKKTEYKADGKDEKKAWYDPEVVALRASRRFFMIVIDKTDSGKMKIWEYSAAWALDNLLKRANRKDILVGDLIFDKKSIIFTPEPSQFDSKNPGEIKTFDFESEGKYSFTGKDIKDTPKLDTMLILHTAEEISNLLWGNSTDDEDADEDEDTPPPASTRSSRRSEPEQEETSSRSSRRRSEPEDTEEPVEEDSREARRRRRETKEESTEPSCPADLTFGEDIDSDDSCEGCAVYAECDKKYNELHSN